MTSDQLDVDTLVSAALDARNQWTYEHQVVDFMYGVVRYLIERGVTVLCDGDPFVLGSLQSWQRFVQDRGLLRSDNGV